VGGPGRNHGDPVDTPDIPIDVAKLENLEYDALIPLYEMRIEDEPEDLQAIHWLGYAYTHVGRYREGLELDRRLSRLIPDDRMVHYNLACSLALLGHTDEAFETLYHAVELGYGDAEHLEVDPDLDSIRSDDRYPDLLARIRDEG